MINFGFLAFKNKKETELLEILYTTHKQQLFRVAYGVLRDVHLAEDMLHEAFMSMLQHINVMQAMPEDERLPWSITIVKNKCLDLLRKQKRHMETPLGAVEYYIEGRQLSPEERSITKAEIKQMQCYFAELTPLDRQILEMHYVLELPYRVIAKKLNQKSKTIEMRVFRAKKQLRKKWDADQQNGG